jgi:hypothetical protein
MLILFFVWQHVQVGSVADVSGEYAASIFRFETYSLGMEAAHYSNPAPHFHTVPIPTGRIKTNIFKSSKPAMFLQSTCVPNVEKPRTCTESANGLDFSFNRFVIVSTGNSLFVFYTLYFCLFTLLSFNRDVLCLRFQSSTDSTHLADGS